MSWAFLRYKDQRARSKKTAIDSRTSVSDKAWQAICLEKMRRYCPLKDDSALDRPGEAVEEGARVVSSMSLSAAAIAVVEPIDD
jgi:hypothetical protein